MWLLDIKKSPKPDKKLEATFCLCEKKNDCKGTNHKVVNFGSKGSSTYIDHKDDKLRSRYIERHRKNENWNDPQSAGALSRYLLWGAYTNLDKNIKAYKRQFKLK